MTHGEQCLGELREKLQEKRQRAFYYKCLLFLNGISCPHDKHLHSTYKVFLFFLIGCQNIAIEPNLVKEYTKCYSQCTLNLNMAFCLVFMLSQLQTILCSSHII